MTCNLSVDVHGLTRNDEFVDLLHKLGVSISHKDVLLLYDACNAPKHHTRMAHPCGWYWHRVYWCLPSNVRISWSLNIISWTWRKTISCTSITLMLCTWTLSSVISDHLRILMFSLAKIQKWCHKQASHATFTRKSGITQVFMSIYLSYIFNMAAAGHFGFWLFPNSAAIFARVMGAHSFLNTPKSSNQMSNLTMLSVVTGPPDITQLIHNGSCVQCWIPPKEALQFHELLFRRIYIFSCTSSNLMR